VIFIFRSLKHKCDNKGRVLRECEWSGEEALPLVKDEMQSARSL